MNAFNPQELIVLIILNVVGLFVLAWIFSRTQGTADSYHQSRRDRLKKKRTKTRLNNRIFR